MYKMIHEISSEYVPHTNPKNSACLKFHNVSPSTCVHDDARNGRISSDGDWSGQKIRQVFERVGFAKL